jgi:S1-C subfamily serine protease
LATEGKSMAAVAIDNLAKLLPNLSAEVAELAARVRPAVVIIRSAGQGAGVIWRPDGVVLTNNHVVARDRVEVVLADGRQLPGEVFRRSPERDLAAIKVPAGDLPSVSVGDSRSLRAGELVVAVGNPLGVPLAVSLGIVSGATRRVRLGGGQTGELIQADVDLYPGNSGGPLVNSRGQVVGLNSMVEGPGNALAVPSHVAQAFLADEAARPFRLGVTLQRIEVPPALARRLGLAEGQGTMIRGISDGGPAERAGLLVGDLVLAIDGKPLGGPEEIAERVSSVGPGGTIRLIVHRGGQMVELEARPEMI